MKASYKERWEGISTGKGNTDVHLLPGQFIFGRHTAAKELKMKAPTVYDRMKKLVEIKNCTMESHTHYSIVTVCNWANYQEEEKPIHQPIHQPTINQPSTNHHKQESKEGKEGKKEKIKKNAFGEFANVMLSETEMQKLSNRFNGSLEKRIERLSIYLEKTGKRYKSHYATILSWAEKDERDGVVPHQEDANTPDIVLPEFVPPIGG